MKLFSPEARSAYMALSFKAQCGYVSVCVCMNAQVPVCARRCTQSNVWTREHMDIKGWHRCKSGKPKPHSLRESCIKQILLPKGWPLRSVGVQFPVVALRASASVKRHSAVGVAAEMTARESDAEMRQFGGTWSSAQSEVVQGINCRRSLDICFYFCVKMVH